MTPLRDAMRFIDGDHTNLCLANHLNEPFVVQAFRRYISKECELVGPRLVGRLVYDLK